MSGTAATTRFSRAVRRHHALMIVFTVWYIVFYVTFSMYGYITLGMFSAAGVNVLLTLGWWSLESEFLVSRIFGVTCAVLGWAASHLFIVTLDHWSMGLFFGLALFTEPVLVVVSYLPVKRIWASLCKFAVRRWAWDRRVGTGLIVAWVAVIISCAALDGGMLRVARAVLASAVGLAYLDIAVAAILMAILMKLALSAVVTAVMSKNIASTTGRP